LGSKDPVLDLIARSSDLNGKPPYSVLGITTSHGTFDVLPAAAPAAPARSHPTTSTSLRAAAYRKTWHPHHPNLYHSLRTSVLRPRPRVYLQDCPIAQEEPGIRPDQYPVKCINTANLTLHYVLRRHAGFLEKLKEARRTPLAWSKRSRPPSAHKKKEPAIIVWRMRRADKVHRLRISRLGTTCFRVCAGLDYRSPPMFDLLPCLRFPRPPATTFYAFLTSIPINNIMQRPSCKKSCIEVVNVIYTSPHLPIHGKTTHSSDHPILSRKRDRL
jgi:hypothetical protein